MLHKYEQHPVPVAIVGARGYSGLELVRALLKHPQAKIEACFATDSAFRLGDYLPEEAAANLSVRPLAELGKTQAKAVFLATPVEASLELAPKLVRQGVDVIDLSGAFRLRADPAAYDTFYGFKHPDTALLAQAHYGLVPWAGPAPATGRDQGRLVSNPGCYATAILMALLPLLREGLIRAETLVIDAKSGTSGAGRKASESQLFTEVEGDCVPYKVGEHQHGPEIRQWAKAFTGQAIDPMLATHLLPVRRGITAAIYARATGGATEAKLAQAFSAAYESYPLVRHGSLDAAGRFGVSLRQVTGSARTVIRYRLKGDQLYVFSLIDNLMKGAATQAIENFNRLNDLAPTTALTDLEGAL